MRSRLLGLLAAVAVGCATTGDPGATRSADPVLGLEPVTGWPNVPSPPNAVTTVTELLTEIERLVELDRAVFTSSGDLEQQRARVAYLVLACRDGLDPEAKHSHVDVDLLQHAWGVHYAWSYAWAAWNVNVFGPNKTAYWRRCADELEHLEGGMSAG